MNHLNNVTATVFIDGNPCEFTTLRLEQKFNGHHFFDIGILCSPLNDKSIWCHEREELIAMQWKKLSIHLRHEDSGDETIFRGFITRISIDGKEGVTVMLHYKGYSPTFLLESGKTMDSFTNYTLAEIVREVVRNYGDGVEVVIAPQFHDRIPYLQMQEESGYEFLRRIAYQYGEWFYYDGQKLYFGNPHIDKEETVTYDVELKSVDYESDIHPRHLSHFLNMEKGREIASMTRLEGKSNTCRIRLAHPVTIKIPDTMYTRRDLGRYRIMSVTHVVDEKGVYSNTFEGIPDNMEYIPVDNVVLPKAYPMIGTVVDNSDPEGRGRVQVQFAWQKERNKSTGWIRVSYFDLGESEASIDDRDFVFTPKVGDQVMVYFKGNNPGRPYVRGGFLQADYPHQGQVDNKVKSISTRSGHTLEFYDSKEGGWGIIIKDKGGNTTRLDIKGKNIEISAPEFLALTGRNVCIRSDGKLEIRAGKLMELMSEAGINIAAKENVSQQANGNLESRTGGNVDVEAASEFSSAGKTMLVEGSSEVSISGKKIEISGSKTTVQGSSNKVELD